jgi:hypothetical protein
MSPTVLSQQQRHWNGRGGQCPALVHLDLEFNEIETEGAERLRASWTGKNKKTETKTPRKTAQMKRKTGKTGKTAGKTGKNKKTKTERKTEAVGA